MKSQSKMCLTLVCSTIVLDILFSILGLFVVSYYSRQREYRADKGAAQITGSAKTSVLASKNSEKSKNPTKNELQPNELKREQLSKKKLSYKEQKELDGLPALIQTLESQQKAIAQELFDGSLYSSNPKRAAELTAKNAKMDDELLEAMQRWESLSI